MADAPTNSQDPYVDRFMSSPLYVTVMSDTMRMARCSYTVAQWLSVLAFAVGVALIIAAVVFAATGSENLLAVVFSGLGTASMVGLLLYRPIERIQSGVNGLIKSQIACASFLAEYDSIARTLATVGQLPLDRTDRAEQLRLGQYLSMLTSKLIADLDGCPEAIVQVAANQTAQNPD